MFVFRSDAAPDIMMFGEVAKRMLEIIGKEPGERGVITVHRCRKPSPGCAPPSRRTRRATAPTARRRTTSPPTPGTAGQPCPAGDSFVEQLELSLQRGKPVLWGV